MVNAALSRQKMDHTLAGYAISSLTGLLNVVLIISILGAFGVQTTTFAALFAAFGLAIGSAWGGLLSNFAAGVFMVVLRPFKVGEFIEAGGVIGTVVEIGPFVTKINAPDNVLNIVGNSKIFAAVSYTHLVTGRPARPSPPRNPLGREGPSETALPDKARLPEKWAGCPKKGPREPSGRGRGCR